MTNINSLIDQLPPPQFPDNYSENDRQKILLALNLSKQQIRPYEGNFEAHWLLTPFESNVWETTNRGREELIDGKWHHSIRINWHIEFHNGAYLTDRRYERLLLLAKTITFLSRSNMIGGKSAPNGWHTQTLLLLAVIRWIVLHEERFLPEQYGLRLLDQPALDWLFNLLAEGGWSKALQINQRILAAIYLGTHGFSCSQPMLDNHLTIPSTEIAPMVKWLEHQRYYKPVKQGVNMGKRMLRRGALAKLINVNRHSLTSPNISRFLRQFEPDFNRETLLISSTQITEFPSHSIESLQKNNSGASGEGTILVTGSLISTILDSHRHLPDLLPEPASISLQRSITLANRVARPPEHTLFMPINTGLTYLNTAIRFVHLYGESIIDLYLAVIAHGNSKRRIKNPSWNRILQRITNDKSIASSESIASILNITEFRRQEANVDFNRFRSNPTLDEALRVLIGSCVVCMVLLKPSREDEITHLKRNCLREYAGGYWINFHLGKSNTGEAWLDEDRPIPVISAKAIHLLQRLGGSLSTLFAEGKKIGGNLFYLPKAQGIGALSASSELLNEHLDIFCDYVGLPPDDEGRRWYVRTHEMRKWFLLLLFWSGRFDVLDAARWIAGHTDAEHIYAYIEKEFPGEELPRLEAEYSIDRMYRRDQERKRGEDNAENEDSVDVLYEAVLQHFNVESLTMIPESEWSGYVLSLREEEKFRLEPHSIFGENGRDIVGINVSFVMREAT